MLSLLALVLGACQPSLEPTPEVAVGPEAQQFMDFPALTGGDRVGTLRLPEGTRVEAAADHQSARFYLPEGYAFIYITASGEIAESEQIIYTCNCSEGSGCNVIKIVNDYGCLQGVCLGTCTGGFSEPGEPSKARIQGVITIANLEGNISLITQDESLENLLEADPILLDHPKISQALSTFLQELSLAGEYARYKTLNTEVSDRYVAMNFFGTLLAFRAPSYIFDLYENPLKEVVCRCNSGQLGCTLADFSGSGALFICEGDECVSCSLLDGAGPPPGED